MTAERYMLIMRKHLSARGSLLLFVRTHHHLEYYFNLHDARGAAANQGGIGSAPACAQGVQGAKVVEMHPVALVQARHRL
jgi:hypothetical protein